MRQESTNIRDLTRNFVYCLESEGKSPKTIESYFCFLKRFALYLEQHDLPTNVAEISLQDIREFLHYLQFEAHRWETSHGKDTKPLTLHSVHGHGRVIKTFWSWLSKEGYLEENNISNLKLPRLPKVVINTFSVDQINALLSACKRDKVNGERNYLIIMLFLDTGLRLSELVDLTTDNVGFENSCLTIKGKGNKERVVPFGSQVRRLLRR